MDLEELWELREEKIYPEMFGPVSRGIFTLSQELFSAQFKQSDIDPRWLFLGIIEYSPTPDRNSWLYVTSGYSNPWDVEPEAYDPAGESGAGVEFVLQTSERGDWAITTLQSMLAYDLLLAAGRFTPKEPLSIHDRIPLSAPINGKAECLIRNLVVEACEGVPSEFALPSGKVQLMGFTGITDPELDFAKATSSAALIERLREAGHHPITNPNRPSILTD